jgi:hypothetical protein
VNEKFAHPDTPAGKRRLKRLDALADKLEKMQRDGEPGHDLQGKVSAIRWAVRMLKVYRNYLPTHGKEVAASLPEPLAAPTLGSETRVPEGGESAKGGGHA